MEKQISYSNCPCIDATMLRSILDSPFGLVAFALDKDYKYLLYSRHHADIMKKIWGTEIQIGQCMLDVIKIEEDRLKAKRNFDRALNGEFFSLKEEYGEGIARAIWKNDYSPLYEKDTVMGLTVFVLDLTGVVETEKQLKMVQIHKEVIKEREALLNSIGEGLYGVDVDGKCFFINPAALKILGFTKEEIIDKETHSLFHHHKSDGTVFPKEECFLEKVLTLNEQITQRDWLFKKNGEMFPVEVIATPINKENRVVGTIVSFRDITEQYVAEEQLKRSNELLHVQSITDPLTELYNRRHLMDIGVMQFKISQHNRQPLSVLAFDIDFFKRINDIYGHDIGDQILINVAKAAQTSLRSTDMLARVGGEEFTVLLVNTDYEHAYEIAKRLQSEIVNSYVLIGEKKVYCTVSIGVVTSNENIHNFTDMLKIADIQLYKAKENGRNRIEPSDLIH